jgi:hypothetical protein
VVKTDAGWTVETGAWKPGSYDCVTNTCHNAANGGVDAGNDGIISCNGKDDGRGGHTINWSHPDDSTICISDPQVPGGGPAQPQKCDGKTPAVCMAVSGCGWIVPNGPCNGTPKVPVKGGGTCCFPAGLTKDGLPDLSSAAAKDCLKWGCGNQYDPVNTRPLPKGTKWPIPDFDCTRKGTQTGAACRTCCADILKYVVDGWTKTCPAEKQAFAKACLASCGGGALPPVAGGNGDCSKIKDRATCLSTIPRGAASSCAWTEPNGPCGFPTGYRPQVPEDPADLFGCQSDADCSGSTPSCDLAGSTCVAAGTSDPDTGTTYCQASTDCPTSAALCSYGTCDQCTQDSDCLSGAVCNYDGTCATTSAGTGGSSSTTSGGGGSAGAPTITTATSGLGGAPGAQ